MEVDGSRVSGSPRDVVFKNTFEGIVLPCHPCWTPRHRLVGLLARGAHSRRHARRHRRAGAAGDDVGR